MSRTFRRKGWEKTIRVNGSKINGFYTTWDSFLEYPCINGHGGVRKYRAMTKEEFNKKYWLIHGDSSHNLAWGTNRFKRKLIKRRLNTFNDCELRRYLKNPQGYECMAVANMKDDSWF